MVLQLVHQVVDVATANDCVLTGGVDREVSTTIFNSGLASRKAERQPGHLLVGDELVVGQVEVDLPHGVGLSHPHLVDVRLVLGVVEKGPN